MAGFKCRGALPEISEKSGVKMAALNVKMREVAGKKFPPWSGVFRTQKGTVSAKLERIEHMVQF